MKEEWDNLNLRSGKWSHYFKIYEHEIRNLDRTNFTLIEVGVKDGGSLEYWKLRHPSARIIGVDLNPKCLSIDPNFEIYIGDQADPEFWDKLFKSVGSIQVLIDDGGHSYHQQIQTVESALQYMEEGVIIVEDTHTSFLNDFFPETSYTFMEYATSVANLISLKSYSDDPQRFSFQPNQNVMRFYENIHSVSFYQNIVVFRISRKDASKSGRSIINSGKSSEIDDFRYNGLKSSFVPSFDSIYNLHLIETPLPPIAPSSLLYNFRKLVRIMFSWIRKFQR